jgi:hypothetical protein
MERALRCWSIKKERGEVEEEKKEKRKKEKEVRRGRDKCMFALAPSHLSRRPLISCSDKGAASA